MRRCLFGESTVRYSNNFLSGKALVASFENGYQRPCIGAHCSSKHAVKECET